jgi:TorA maturation chaperone TorD
MDILQEDTMTEVALDRGNTYKSLATAFLYPTSDVADHLSQLNGVSPIDREGLEREYNRLFAHLGSAKCPPYETEYGHENVFQKTEAMADIAGFYKAYGLEPSEDNTERVDFLGSELEFMAFLSFQEAYARQQNDGQHLEICLDSQRMFMQDHLGRWVGVFSSILKKSTELRPYLEVNAKLESFIASEVDRLQVPVNPVTGPSREQKAGPEPFGCDACVSQSENSPG